MFALAFGLVAAPQLAVPTAAVADANGAEDDNTADDGTGDSTGQDDDTTADDVVEEGAVRLSLTAGVHGVVDVGAPVTSTVSVDNGSDEEVASGRITVELNATPLADAAALTAWMDTAAAPGTFIPLGTETLEAVPASESATLSVSATAATVGALAPGIYPLRASLSGVPSSGALTTTSVLIVSDDRSAQITVLVPITATPEGGALLTAEELTELTAPDGALTAQLDGVAGSSAVLGIDPLIPASIRALGSSVPATATAWLTRMESLSNERFALQAGDADATVQARAGLPRLLEPLALTSFLDPADFLPDSEANTPTPSPSATPSEPELPTSDELTAFRDSASDVLWPVGDVRTADLETFDAYLDADATTILPSSALSATASALVDVDGHRVLAMDADASASISDAATATDDATREREIVTGLAQLTFNAQTSLLIGLDRDETRTADSLREAILSLSAVGQPTTLVGLTATAPAPGTLTGDDTADRSGTLRALLADEDRLTSFASILDDPLVLLSPERLEILRLIGVGAVDEFVADAAAHRTETAATLNAVGVQQPSPIQLFTAAAPLPVWIRNDLPWPVNVTLSSQPSDARLDIQPSMPVEALPASNTRVKVPVEARVGSGVLDVRFGLTSPTGVQIGADQSATVTVRAEWEGIGLGILGGIIGLLLILGIVRTIVRRRKEQ